MTLCEDEFYVTRREDNVIFELLRKSEFCTVTASRSMGKTSLVHKLSSRLRTENIHSVKIGLEAIGRTGGIEQWYIALLRGIVGSFQEDINIEDWWKSQQETETPNERFLKFFREHVVHRGTPVVIFIDEINLTFDLDFSDDFFRAIRHMYQNRKIEYKNFSFCFLGVATRKDLLKQQDAASYDDVGEEIELHDFNREQDDCTPLEKFFPKAASLLKTVFKWTDGHPFLTVYFCDIIQTKELYSEGAIEEYFNTLLKKFDRKKDFGDEDPHRKLQGHLNCIEEFFKERVTNKQEFLKVYRKIGNGNKHVDKSGGSCDLLKLSGLVKTDGSGQLVIRNALYKSYFNEKWIKQTQQKYPSNHGKHNKIVIALLTIVVLFVSGLGVYSCFDTRVSLPRRRIYELNTILNTTFSADEGLRAYQYWVGEKKDPVLDRYIRGHEEEADDAYEAFSHRIEQQLAQSWLDTLNNSQNLMEQKRAFHVLTGDEPEPNVKATLKGFKKAAYDWLADRWEHKLLNAGDLEEAKQIRNQLGGIEPINEFDRIVLEGYGTKARQAFNTFLKQKKEDAVQFWLTQIDIAADERQVKEIFDILEGRVPEPELGELLDPDEQLIQKAKEKYWKRHQGRLPEFVKVVRQGTRIYQNASISWPLPNQKLQFNNELRVLDVQGSRAKVQRLNELTPLGWVERSSLLVNTSPLVCKDTGLLQKYYVIPSLPFFFQKRNASPDIINAYPSPEMQACDTCASLLPFSAYFIADETEQSYLLSKKDDNSQLVGWVYKQNGIVWNTALGIRPKESLNSSATELQGREESVCAYLNREDAIKKQHCLPILGGARWFRYPYRIPVLEKVRWGKRDYYKVLLSLPGIASIPGKNEEKIGISRDLFPKDLDPILLMSQKPIDIFFLIDGTKSMQPYIDAIGLLADKILHNFHSNNFAENMRVRLGFRIYRDKYAGAYELDEGLPMDSSCEWNAALQQQNLSKFQRKIADIREISSVQIARKEKDDDYEENVFGGIQKSIEDLKPCPEHTKLLFIIGDCGYNGEKQKMERGRQEITEVEVADMLKQKHILSFFIQTPNHCSSVKRHKQDECNYAYERFTNQSRTILRLLGYTDKEIDEYYFMTTEDESKLNDKILSGILKSKNRGEIKQLEIGLHGGNELVLAIQQLQGKHEDHVFPGIYWETTQKGECRNFGDGCTGHLYDTMFIGYIPVSPKIAEDICLSEKELTLWRRLLRGIHVESLKHLGGKDLRSTFVQNLKFVLEQILNKDFYDDTNTPLALLLKHEVGLPVRNDSPVFHYSLDDLENREILSDADVELFVSKLEEIEKFLEQMSYGDLPLFQPQGEFPEDLPERYDSALATVLTQLDSTLDYSMKLHDKQVLDEIFEKDPRMHYDHMFQNTHIYWVPKELLP